MSKYYERTITNIANFSRKGMSTDQINHFKLLQNRCAQLEIELTAYTDLLTNLASIYKAHKGEFPLLRYSELKRAIKLTLEQYQKLLNCSGGRRKSRNLGTGVMIGQPNRANVIANILSGARELAEKRQEQLDDDAVYSFSRKEMVAKCESLDQKYQKLRNKIEICKDSLSFLASSYSDSKNNCPPIRYGIMKDMIKDVVSVCT